MPVLAKFCGIVIRMLISPMVGTRLHAFFGDSEVVVALNPLRLIQSDAPAWVNERVLAWARDHDAKVLSPWNTGAAAFETTDVVTVAARRPASPPQWLN